MEISGPNSYRGRHRFHSGVYRGAPQSKPAQTVGAALRSVAVEATQRRAVQHGLPRTYVNAAPGGRDRTARSPASLAESVCAAGETAADADRHDTAFRPAEPDPAD